MKALAFILALPLASGAGEPNGRWALAPGDSRPTGDARLETIELGSRIFGNTRALRVLLPPGYVEPAWGRRLPGALRFLYGPGEGGTVIQRVGAEE